MNERGIHPEKRVIPKFNRLRQQGEVHDLHSIAEKILRGYFWGIQRCESCAFLWGEKYDLRVQGTYYNIGGKRYVVINPAFDDATVPEYVIGFIVFHELLHAYYEEDEGDPHDEVFGDAEKVYENYHEARSWLKIQWSVLFYRKRSESRDRRREERLNKKLGLQEKLPVTKVRTTFIVQPRELKK